jgi:hypothetical protein
MASAGEIINKLSLKSEAMAKIIMKMKKIINQ